MTLDMLEQCCMLRFWKVKGIKAFSLWQRVPYEEIVNFYWSISIQWNCPKQNRISKMKFHALADWNYNLSKHSQVFTLSWQMAAHALHRAQVKIRTTANLGGWLESTWLQQIQAWNYTQFWPWCPFKTFPLTWKNENGLSMMKFQGSISQRFRTSPIVALVLGGRY